MKKIEVKAITNGETFFPKPTLKSWLDVAPKKLQWYIDGSNIFPVADRRDWMLARMILLAQKFNFRGAVLSYDYAMTVRSLANRVGMKQLDEMLTAIRKEKRGE